MPANVLTDSPSTLNGSFIPLAEAESRPAARTEIKIAYIGGGSREWAVKLMGDLALNDRLTGSLVLHDINHEASLLNQKLSEEIFDHPQARTSFHVRAESRLSVALKDADFVVISIEPGPVSLRYADLEIPAKYGVLQTVGDTTGPGGLLRSLRCVPMLQEFAHAIMEHCPNAWVINYTNPMAICTAALFAAEPQIKAFGCCHEIFGTQKLLAGLVEKWFETARPPRQEIDLAIAGVNHFTWATHASWRGHDLMPRLKEMADQENFYSDMRARSIQAQAKGEWFTNHGKIAFDLLRRFGALGAAGDRHLSEFVPWYLLSEDELHSWGIVRTPYSWRLQRSEKPPAMWNGTGRHELKPSGEEGVQQIEALLGLRSLVTNVNLPNAGQMAAFPRGCIVETHAEFRQNAIRPVLAHDLPPAAEALVRRAVSEQSLTLSAALHRDKDEAFQVLVTNPLVRLPMNQAGAMFREMLEATRDYLPGWNI